MFKPLKYILIIVSIFLFSGTTAHAQNSAVDSLHALLKKSRTDTIKVKLLNSLGWELMYYNPDTAIILGKQSLLLAQKLKWQNGISKTYNQLGVYNYLKGDNENALEYYSKSVEVDLKHGNKKNLPATYSNMGVIYDGQGNYSRALEYYFKALKLEEQAGNKPGISAVICNIGTVYRSQRDFKKALHYYFRSLAIDKAIGEKNNMSVTLGNIGFVYYELMAHHPEAEGTDTLYEQSLYYLNEALKMDTERNDKYGIARQLGNIGNVYSERAKFIKDKTQQDALINKALDNYFKVLKIDKELGNKSHIAIIKTSIGYVFIHQKKYREAEKYLLDALKINREIGAKKYEMNVESLLTDLYAKTNRYQLALVHFKQSMELKDSIFNEEKNKEITRNEMNYEFEKKEAAAKAAQEKKDLLAKTEAEKKDEINAAEKKRQLIVIVLVSCVLLIVMVFAFFILRSLKTTRKQKVIIEEQKLLVEEKHKEITDSINYAERIQKSFLATQTQLDQNLKNHFVLFQPKDVVSGDFYWSAVLNNGNFALACADSTGHGVPGAIMSILNISSLEKAIEKENQPAEILNQTRKYIIERLKKDGSAEGGKDGMDCSLLSFDFHKMKLAFALANNPLWIIRNGNMMEFSPDKMPVGKHDKDQNPFKQQEFELQKGDMIYTLTDGYPDQFGGPKGKKFKYANLQKLLLEIHRENPEIQKSKLRSALLTWKGDLEQVDDICVIGIGI